MSVVSVFLVVGALDRFHNEPVGCRRAAADLLHLARFFQPADRARHAILAELIAPAALVNRGLDLGTLQQRA